MSKQINSNETGLVRIDASWLYYAKLEAAKQRRSIKSLVEEGLEFVLGIDKHSAMHRGKKR